MMRSVAVLTILLIALVGCGGGDSSTAGEGASPQTDEAVAIGAGSGESVSGTHTYVIDPAQSKASYIVHEEFFAGALEKLGIEVGKQDIVGSTSQIAGQLTLNLDDLSAALGENRITVNLPALATTETDRDQWLRRNGLESERFPTAEFVADSIANAPATYADGDEVTFQLVGALTIREIAQPATFDVTARLVGDTIQGVAEADLLMTSFGIDPPSFANTLTVEDAFTVRIDFTAQAE